MPDTETLAARVRALERRTTGGDTDADVAPLESPSTDALEARLDRLETRLAELDADVQAVQGFAGELDTVNDAVERRADAALAAVDRLEADTAATPTPEPEREHGPATGDPPAHPPHRADESVDDTPESTSPGLLARLLSRR